MTLYPGTDIAFLKAPDRERSRDLRLCATRGHVHVLWLDVFLRNGGHRTVPVNLRLPRDHCTSWIKLRGRALGRDVHRISVHYDSFHDHSGHAVLRAEGQ
ncbi:hypothetical protein AIOL_004284 [Candidatus Rhodobacter oscarellae]|uniref:Uncharacterized protein n=2 Tax=Candidatus Rhodobacter oscarellae TaxID=1675527 RepID=A0A0J9E932_9RHOB|nr:hypothetical protein AIOL_004284 [Candidatus Rhodobacter lobularis]